MKGIKLVKTAKWVTLFLLAGVLALAGCGKEKPKAPVKQGVTVDLPKLRAAFATASPELQTAVSEVAMGLRYSEYPRAFAGLDTLANTPGLTEPQKKIVGEVTAQVKEVASKAAASPEPAR
jgi:hypothetical protein